MLNKIILILFILSVSINTAFAENDKKSNPISIDPIYIKVDEPFTALASAIFKITNNSEKSITLKSVSTASARKIGFYEKYKSNIGSAQIRPVKSITIEPNKTLDFRDSNIKILLVGLSRKYLPNEEIIITLKFESGLNMPIYLPVNAQYK